MLADRMCAEVKYFGVIYAEAEPTKGIWFVEDGFDSFEPFLAQYKVHPINGPRRERRIPGASICASPSR
jgi:hypothetical protein